MSNLPRVNDRQMGQLKFRDTPVIKERQRDVNCERDEPQCEMSPVDAQYLDTYSTASDVKGDLMCHRRLIARDAM